MKSSIRSPKLASLALIVALALVHLGNHQTNAEGLGLGNLLGDFGSTINSLTSSVLGGTGGLTTVLSGASSPLFGILGTMSDNLSGGNNVASPAVVTGPGAALGPVGAAGPAAVAGAFPGATIYNQPPVVTAPAINPAAAAAAQGAMMSQQQLGSPLLNVPGLGLRHTLKKRQVAAVSSGLLGGVGSSVGGVASGALNVVGSTLNGLGTALAGSPAYPYGANAYSQADPAAAAAVATAPYGRTFKKRQAPFQSAGLASGLLGGVGSTIGGVGSSVGGVASGAFNAVGSTLNGLGTALSGGPAYPYGANAYPQAGPAAAAAVASAPYGRTFKKREAPFPGAGLASGLLGGVGSSLGGVSSSLGGVGSSVGGVASGAMNAVGSTLNGLGSALSGASGANAFGGFLQAAGAGALANARDQRAGLTAELANSGANIGELAANHAGALNGLASGPFGPASGGAFGPASGNFLGGAMGALGGAANALGAGLSTSANAALSGVASGALNTVSGAGNALQGALGSGPAGLLGSGLAQAVAPAVAPLASGPLPSFNSFVPAAAAAAAGPLVAPVIAAAPAGPAAVAAPALVSLPPQPLVNRNALAASAVNSAQIEAAQAGADMAAHGANNAHSASLAGNAYRQAKLASARDRVNIAGTIQNSARISDAAIATHDAATKAEDSLLGSELAVDSAATVLDSDAAYIPPVTSSLLRSLPYGRLGVRNILPKPLTYPSGLLPDVWLNGAPVNYLNVPLRMLPYGVGPTSMTNPLWQSGAYLASGLPAPQVVNGQPFLANPANRLGNNLVFDPTATYLHGATGNALNGALGVGQAPLLANAQLEAQDELGLANQVTMQQLGGAGMAATYNGYGRTNQVPMLTGSVNDLNLMPTTTIGTTYPIGSALVIEPRDSYFQNYIDSASSRQNFDEKQQ